MVFDSFRGDSESNPQSSSGTRRKSGTQERGRAGARASHGMRERVPATGYSLAPTPGTALPKTDTRYLRYLSSRQFSELDCLVWTVQLQETEVDLRAAGEDSYSPATRSPPSGSIYFFVRSLLHRKKLKITALPQDSLPALPTLPAQSRGRMRARDT